MATPLSTTPTTTAGSPVAVLQASGASMSASAVPRVPSLSSGHCEENWASLGVVATR